MEKELVKQQLEKFFKYMEHQCQENSEDSDSLSGLLTGYLGIIILFIVSNFNIKFSQINKLCFDIYEDVKHLKNKRDKEKGNSEKHDIFDN